VGFLPPNAFSWALYDFANTIFSAIVVTVYLPLHITHLSGRNTPLGIASTFSMILSGLIIPTLGTWSDRTGKTKLYLLISTILCVFATCYLSFTQTSLLLLITFAMANFLYHSSLVFYNSLLPVVSPPEKQGFVSGVGTGLGYLGVLFALPLAHLVDTFYERRWVFLLAGVLFFLFSIPLFAYVPERKVSSPLKMSLGKSLSLLFQNRPVLVFLIGNFLLLDVLNAIILWLSVFLTKSFGISQGTLIRTILALNASAFIFGIVLGKMTDAVGSKKTLLLSTACLATVLLAVGLIQSFAWACFFILLFGGASAAGIWTAGRKIVVELSPKERVGEFFGLYGFTTKVSGVGSVVLSLLADTFGFRVAVLSQLLLVGLATLFLVQVPIPRSSDN